MALSREAEELLFAAGLAEQEAAYDGGAAERARQRELERQRALFAQVERERELERQRALARQREIERQREVERQRALFRAEERRREQERLAAERREEERRAAERRRAEAAHAEEQRRTSARKRTAPREDERSRLKPLVERPRLDSRSKIAGGVLDSFEEERQLRKRNDSLRRAFKAIPGGDEALATIEALVDAEHGTRRATGAPSVLRTVQRTFEADDDREREARIRAEAEKIPMGLDALDLFRREREIGSRNDAVRRALAGDGPRPVGSTSLLSADAEERLWDETLAHEDTLSGDRPSTYRALLEEQRITDAGLAQDEQGSPRGRVSEYDRLKNDERIWQDQLSIEEQAANPREFRSDLLADLREMFAVTGLPFDPAPGSWQGFVGDGVNGLTPEERFFTIGWYAGYSDDQLELLLDGATVEEVGPPAGRWDNELGLSPADRNGALTYLQMREPEGSDPSGEVPRFVNGAVRGIAEGFRVSGEAQLAETESLNELTQQSIDFTVEQLTQAAHDAGDAGRRFLNELEEIKHLGRVEAFERLNQAILGGFTPQFELTPEGIARLAQAAGNPMAMFDWDRALEGLAGNETYRGADHPLLRPLPERYREEFGGLIEQGLTATVLGAAGVGLVASGLGAPLAVAAIISFAAGVALDDLDNENSNLANILEFVVEDAEKLIRASGLDAATETAIREFAEAMSEGIPPPRISLP